MRQKCNSRLAEALYGVAGARGVGRAMATCPGDVPWWRVVHADGSMKGTPGAAEQRARLAEEGVPLTADGRVDWRRAGGPWSPPSSPLGFGGPAPG